MQSISWYIRRLASMSPAEICWRLGGLAQTRMDRLLLKVRQKPLSPASFLGTPEASVYGDSRVVLPSDPANTAKASLELVGDVLAQADNILSGKIHLLGDSPIDVGERINWNYEYRAKRATPMSFSPAIDYRDFATTGDCKWVWELNRHHHLVVLARAYRATGHARYAMEVAQQLDDWLAQCPFGIGMNWRSPLELGIRLINWVWAIEMIRPADVISPTLSRRILESVHRHIWEIDRKYSRFSSANNHLIGEAAGVFIAAAYFRHLKKSVPWRERAKQILIDAIQNQTHPDGGNREQATRYQLFVMQFFSLAAIAAERTGDAMPPAYLKPLEKMHEFMGALCEAGPLPMWGDADDGYVLDLGGPRGDARPWLAVGAALFKNDYLAHVSRGETSVVQTLLGRAAANEISTTRQNANLPLKSRKFPDTGICLLQSGKVGNPAISLTLDAAELGFGAIAAHGHADALSVTLRVNGADFLVDPGTYDYFTYPHWRRHLRRTIAHNTIEIDGKDQSEILGPFLWGRRANARCTHWSVENGRTVAIAEHDGYRRLAGPMTHRRTLMLEGTVNIEMIDELIGDGSHAIRQAFHFAPECKVTPSGPQTFTVSRPEGEITLCLDKRTQVAIHRGDETSMLGFVSRRYHEKSKSTTLIASCYASGNVRLVTHILLSVAGMTSEKLEAYNRQHLHEGHQDQIDRTQSTGSRAG